MIINGPRNKSQASTTPHKKPKNRSQAGCERSAQRPALSASCQRQEMTSGARSQQTPAALEHFGRPVPLICLLSASDKLSSHGMTLQRSYDLSHPGWLSSADCGGGEEECLRALLLTSQLEILTYLYSGGGGGRGGLADGSAGQRRGKPGEDAHYGAHREHGMKWKTHLSGFTEIVRKTSRRVFIGSSTT